MGGGAPLRCQLACSTSERVVPLTLQAMHQSVHQWWNMPEGNPWSYAPVLHSFQVSLCVGVPSVSLGCACRLLVGIMLTPR